MLTPCQCPHAGYCNHLGREMPEAFWKLCRTDKAYYEMFTREAREGKYERRKNGQPPPDFTHCVYRGDVERTQKCKTCGEKTLDAPIYHCELYGECTLRNFGFRGMKQCNRCDDYTKADQ